jgi:hypothetical protein
MITAWNYEYGMQRRAGHDKFGICWQITKKKKTRKRPRTEPWEHWHFE